MPNSRMDELWELISRVPAGRVVSYGELGRSLQRPVSGLLVGRWMANCPEDIPWWRVVASDGRLPVWKRDPNLERLQVARLAEEGVTLESGKVSEQYFYWTY